MCIRDSYVGDSGKEYFNEKFDGRMTVGRQFQSDYFRPFCNKEKVLVDFGCGDGTILRSLPATQKIGVEINPACHEKIERLNRSVDVPIQVHSDLAQVDDEIADVVTSNHCLEHVPSPLETLKEVSRILKPGGTFVLVVPFDDWRNRQNRTWVENDEDQHLFTWCPRSLGNIVLRAGFEIQSCRVSSQAWSPRIFWVDRIFGRKMFKIACRLYSQVTHRRELVCVGNKPAI